MAAVKTHYGIQVQSGGPGVFEQVRETFQERELGGNVAGNQIAMVAGRNMTGLNTGEAPDITGTLDYGTKPVTTSGHENWADTHTAVVAWGNALETLKA